MFASVFNNVILLIPIKFNVFIYDDSAPKIHIYIAETEKSFHQLATSTRLNGETVAGETLSKISIRDYVNLVKDNPVFIKRLPVDLILRDGNTKFDLDVNPEKNLSEEEKRRAREEGIRFYTEKERERAKAARDYEDSLRRLLNEQYGVEGY